MQSRKFMLGLFTASAVVASFAAVHSVAFGSGAPAPDNDTVFVADVNNVIYQVSNGRALPAIDINGKNFRDIIVTDDFNFIIANHTQGGTVLIANLGGANRVITSQIPSPEGLDIAPNGDVYVSSDKVNKIYKLTRTYAGCPGGASPGCPNGGYVPTGTPISVEYPAGKAVKLVADVAVASSDQGGLHRGDILVAVAKPAMILRYSADGTLMGSLAVNFSGEQPSAMTFGPGGSILVTTEEGSLWQFPATGGAPIAKVKGKARGIVFGINGGTPRAFVSVDPGSVQRFDFVNGALVSPPTTVVTGLNNPRGVTFAGAGGASLAVGADVVVETAAGETTFESVNRDGQTNAHCYFFEDVGLRRLDGTLHLQDVSSFPHFLQAQLDENDVVIPGNVQGFVPLGGSRPLFRVCITETTAGVDGIKQIHSDERVWLNFEPPCPLVAWGGPSAHANSFYVPEIGKKEYPIIDWDLGGGETQRVLQNIAVGCGSDQSWSKGRGSLVLLSAIDTTPRDELVSQNLMLLDKAIASGTSDAVGGLGDFIATDLKDSLLDTVQSARDAAERASYADVVTTMTGFLEDVDAAAVSDFTPAGESITVNLDGHDVEVLTPDVRAELKVRSNAVRFEACTQLAAELDPMPPDCSSLTLP
jgi:hypothetical protein